MATTARTDLRFEWHGQGRFLPALPLRRKALVAAATGLVGAAGLVLPVVVYDWASDSHSALELPMAATAWLAGLGHFAQNGYLVWPIVIGIVALTGYALLHGAVFAGFVDRFLRLHTWPETIAAGAVWGFAAWLFSWYTLLPVARDGAPFRATAVTALSVAPTWVFVTGFALLGLVTSLAYRLMRR